jgi:3'-phosphoadenosine 5'-phosphosulfate sulfotransferase (PAPS reductase)/FAD synthetase
MNLELFKTPVKTRKDELSEQLKASAPNVGYKTGSLKHIISFSGGKDSTAMLLKMVEMKMPIDEVIFCDVGLEFPQMYEHIDSVEKYLGIKITKVRDPKGFEFYLEKYGWSNFKFRWCTTTLKLQHKKKYLKKYQNRIEYLGIAFDEKERTEKKHHKKFHNLRYPLIEWEMTERDCLQYCYERGFNWDGLYEKFRRVSCFCCPLKGMDEYYNLYKFYPDLWNELKRLDKLSEKQFRFDLSVNDMEIIFETRGRQVSLFEPVL